MDEKKENQANRLVKKSMLSALLKLVKEKPLSTITISELTKAADVSRMSFYRNYETVEEVFEEHLKELVADYRKEDEKLAEGKYFSREFIIHCFSCFDNNKEFISGLISCGMSDMFLNTITEYVLEKWTREDSTQESIYMLHSYAGALYSLYLAWAQRDFAEKPEELAVIMERILCNDITC